MTTAGRCELPDLGCLEGCEEAPVRKGEKEGGGSLSRTAARLTCRSLGPRYHLRAIVAFIKGTPP
jgi:hypothetical protein